MVAISSVAPWNGSAPVHATRGTGLARARYLRRTLPKPFDLAALKLGRLETAVLVGVTGGGSDCRHTDCVAHPAHRSYIVFPRLLVRPSGFTVEDGQSPRVDELAGGALFVIAMWAACAWGTWRYWGPPSRVGGATKQSGLPSRAQRTTSPSAESRPRARRPWATDPSVSTCRLRPAAPC